MSPAATVAWLALVAAAALGVTVALLYRRLRALIRSQSDYKWELAQLRGEMGEIRRGAHPGAGRGPGRAGRAAANGAARGDDRVGGGRAGPGRDDRGAGAGRRTDRGSGERDRGTDRDDRDDRGDAGGRSDGGGKGAAGVHGGRRGRTVASPTAWRREHAGRAVRPRRRRPGRVPAARAQRG